jgi:hypothetical protein
VALVELPVETIYTFWCAFAVRNLVVGYYNVLDHSAEGMGANADSPPFVAYNIVNAALGCMACSFKCITGPGASRSRTIA